MVASARLIPIFGTPVFTRILDGHEALDQKLRDVILARQNSDPGACLSNVHGWQSGSNMMTWGSEAASRLACEAIAMADTATIDIGAAEEQSRVRWSPEMWANVNMRGASNQTHWHPGSYLSAVYYADNGYAGSSDPTLGGELVFIDPRMPYIHMRTPDLYFRDAHGATSGHETWVRPAPGLLILFPSYLAHSVRPYLGGGQRITVAINLVASLDPA